MTRTPAPLSRPFRESDLAAAAAAGSASHPRASLAVKLVLGGVALLAAAIGMWRWLDDTSARDQVQVLQTLPQAPASSTATTSAATYPFDKDRSASGEPAVEGMPAPTSSPQPSRRAAPPPAPPGVAPQQWQAMVAQLSSRPDAADQIARLDTYYRFADTVRQFRELTRDLVDEPTPALVALAKRIDTDLEQHVVQRTVATAEAYDIKALVLEVLEPDPDAADEKLERWSRRVTRDQTADARETTRRTAEFERRKTALVEAWSAQPAARRDPKALERDIQSLHQDIFGAPSR